MHALEGVRLIDFGQYLAGTPGAIRGPRPTPGQHNQEIFGELGYSAAEIATFAGVV